MRPQIRKSMAATLHMVVIFGLVLMAACSTAKSPGPTQASRPEATPSPTRSLPQPSNTPSNATPDINTGNVTITFADLSMDFEWMDYKPLVNAFHKQNPTINVVVIPIDHAVQLSFGDYARQADVVYLDGSNPATLPGFLSIQPLLDASPDFNQSDFWPSSFNACSDDQGTPYGVPLVVQQVGIYYDPRIFDRTHTLYPKPGWTWDQFRQAISQVAGTKADGSPIYGLVDGPASTILDWMLDQYFLANNGSFDSKALAASLDWYVQFAKQKALYPVQPPNSQGMMTFQDMNDLIDKGQAAMWIDQPGWAANRTQGDRSIYVPFPIDSTNDHTTPVSPVCGAISSGTKSPQAAWAWLQFLSQQDLTSGRDSSGNFSADLVPARQSLAKQSPYWRSRYEDQRNAMQYALEHAFFYPVSLYASGMSIWNTEQAIISAIQSGTDLATALQGVALASTSNPQATPTSTLGPVVLNTAPVAPTLPEGSVAINFSEAAIMAMTDLSSEFNGTAIQALVAAFGKLHPEIRVILTPYSNDNWGNFPKLAQSNDCFIATGPGGPDWVVPQNDVLDLTPFLDANTSMKADFYPAYLKLYQQDGKQFGLPADVSVQYIAYDADLLTQKGITLPKAGWTVDDLLSIATLAANPSAAAPVYGFADADAIFRSMGVLWYDNSVRPPKPTLNSEAMVQTMTWLQQLFQKKALFQEIYYTYTDYLNMIPKGQITMWLSTGFLNYNTDPWGALRQPMFDQNLPFKVGYIAPPLLASGRAMSTSQWSIGYYISSQASQAKAQACWEWIKFLSDRPTIFGGFTPRQSVLPKEGVGQDPARLAAVQDAIQQYNNDDYGDYTDPLLWVYTQEKYTAQQAVLGGGDVASALAGAQSRSEAYLACISQKDLQGLDNAQLFALVQTCYTIPTPPATPNP